MREDLISSIFYNRESEKYGSYKVVKFLENRGKTEVPYYVVKFKNSGNLVEVSLKNIESNTVVDIESKKKETVKKTKAKKKEKRQAKVLDSNTVEFGCNEEINLLSIDAATISTGIAVSKNGKIIYYTYFYISDYNNSLTKRINYMKKEILKVIHKYNINCVVIEDTINKDYSSTTALSKLAGVILDSIFELGISRVVPYNVIKWKSTANINQYKKSNKTYHDNTRDESKELTYLYVKDKLEIDIKKEFDGVCEEHKKKEIWQDLCDAIAINHVFFHKGIIIEDLF